MKKIKLISLALITLLFITACSCSKIKEYTITFDSNGGTKISSQTIKENDLVNKPSDPTREGYTFNGWYNGKVKYDFNTKVTENLNLTAKWTKNETVTPDDNKEPEKEEVVVKTYTVTFNTDGGTKLSSIKVKENDLITKPDTPVKEGYNFLGWYLNNKTYNFSTKVTSDITLLAKWEKVKTTEETGKDKPVEEEPDKDKTSEKEEEIKTYTVTFNTLGGSKIDSSIVKENEKVTKPIDPTKDQYCFLGWYLDGIEYDFNTLIDSDITLTAKWQYIPTISYIIEKYNESITNQIIIYVTKDGEKIDGYLDILANNNEVITKEISKDGYITNSNQIIKITNPKEK